MFKRIIKLLLVLSLIAGLIVCALTLSVGIYWYIRITRDLPRIEKLSDYEPKAVSSIYAVDGTIIGEVFEQRRYPARFDEIPELVKNAFLAAEDADFYKHQGIDFKGIVRAIIVNLRSKDVKQGASTITQQIVKSLLLTREKTYERKIKEALLAYRLEQALSKDDIFSIYLNEIFLGAGAYGVKAAGRVHFHKELDELSIAEAAYLAGLPKKPTDLTRLENREEALQRQRYVIGQMAKKGFISVEEEQRAKEEKLTIFPQEEQTVFAAPYFATHVISYARDLFRQRELFKNVKSDITPTDPGGYEIHTTADLDATRIAERSLRRGLKELDKRRGWRGPLRLLKPEEIEGFIKENKALVPGELEAGEIYEAIVKSVSKKTKAISVQVGSHSGMLDWERSKWAERFMEKEERVYFQSLVDFLKPGHVIEVELVEPPAEGERPPAEPQAAKVFFLSQTPEVEGAFLVTNILTGEIPAIIGGYDFRRSKFNRATQGLLQPGSAFKPFIYLTAVEVLNFTPSTIVPDSPISLVAGNGQLWSPANFDKKFLGPITLRTALERSRNVVSVYLLRKVGVDRAIEWAKRLGITTPIPREMSIALGTPEVKLIDITRAYGVFGAGGWLARPLVIRSIRNRRGKEIYSQKPFQEKVLSEDSAFIMANMMKGVVENGTAKVVSKLGKPAAGKTGTTNDQRDSWFIGYTPEWAAGVYVGFDAKRNLGRFETGGKVAAPVFLYFMQEFLRDAPPLDFDIPEGVIPVPVDKQSGMPVDADSPGAFVEYFKIGTEPVYSTQELEIPKDYLSSDEF